MRNPKFIIITVVSLICFQASAQIWGTTTGGGTNNAGVIFKTNADGTGYSVVKHFLTDPMGASPAEARLTKANGKLYGLTLFGGPGGYGGLFEFDISGDFTPLSTFDPAVRGIHPRAALTLGTNGKLYGSTSIGGAHGSGTLFSWEAGTLTVLHDFDYSVDGSGVVEDLVEFNGKFYGVIVVGTTNNQGGIFEYNPSNGNVVIKQSMSGVSGTFPRSIRLHSNGKMYGTTFTGALFEYDPTNDIYAKKADVFSGPLVELPNGMMYGASYTGGANGKGGIIEFDPTLTGVTFKADFSEETMYEPTGVLVVGSDGKLYGHTLQGGVHNEGVLFSYDITGATLAIEHEFDATSGTPTGSLMEESTGKIYGLTQNGGEQNVGTLYQYNYLTDTYTKKVDFKYALDGGLPLHGLMLAPDGKLFGTTGSGGQSTGGVLFELDRTTGIYGKRFDFSVATGTDPLLPTAYEGRLFGMTQSGDGTLYEFDLLAQPPILNIKKELKPLGLTAVSSFVLAPNAKLYGLARENSKGVILEYDPPSNTLTKKVTFDGTATLPSPILSLSSDGALYGATTNGGANNLGILYQYVPGEESITLKFDFTTASGYSPAGEFASPGNGKLYGATYSGGTFNFGTVFEYELGSGAFTVKHSFGAGGIQGSSGLTLSNGKLYGVTGTDGANSKGTIYEFDYVGNSVTDVHDFDGATGGPTYSTALAASPMTQTIYFVAPDDQKLSQGTFDLTVVSTSGLPVAIASSDPAIAEVNGKTVTIKTLGTVTLTASQAGTLFFSAATNVAQPLTIIKGDQIITFEALPAKTFDDAMFTLTASTTAALPVTFTSSDAAVATINGNELTINGAGTTIITASQAGDSDYNAAAPVQQTLTVAKATQMITWDPLDAATFGDANITLTASSSSSLPLTYESSNTSIATISGNELTTTGAGTATITASQAGDANYLAATPFAHDLVVAKAAQTITFDAIADKTLGDAVFDAHAVASSGLDVTYSSSSDKISIAGNTVTLIKAGTVTIVASQAGNANFLAANNSRQFCIRPPKATITSSGLNAATVLTSSSTVGNQWQLNGTDINGATNSTLNPTVAGTYTVKVTIDGCTSVPSDGVPLVITGDIQTHQSITFYPNPAHDRLYVAIPGNQGSRLRIIGMDGRVQEDVAASTELVEVNVGEYPQGVYLLNVNAGEKTFVARWVKR